MIEIKNVTKRFFTLTALDNVSLQLPQGEVVGVLGPNGAGKTTLFKLIAGLLTPDAGSIQPGGPSWPIIGYKPERLLYPGHLRVRQYLRVVASLANVPDHQVNQVVANSLARVSMTEAADKHIKDCSKGMRQRLGLAQALIGDPPLLLLDEPSNGLDPEGQAYIRHHIQELHAEGKTIILSSHQLQEVTQVCTYLVILNRGKVHYENTMAQALQERPHAIIQVDRELSPIRELLCSLHPGVEVNGAQITLHNEALARRRAVLSVLLSAGFDVVHLEQQRDTLEEVYARAVQ